MNLVQFKSRFFRDLDKIQNAKERAAKWALSRFGAFVRTRARGSLRRRKKVSQPGQPPSVHSSDSFATLKNILFAYSPETESVIIGPVGLNSSKRMPVTELHEKGGSQAVTEVQSSGGKWSKSKGGVRIDGRPVRTRQAQYPARPYMAPAFVAELPKAAPMFKDMVR